MLNFILGKVVGSQNARILKHSGKTVAQINALESSMKELSQESLKSKSDELRARLKKRVEELGGGLTLEGKIPEGVVDLSDEDAVASERKRRLKIEGQAMKEILPEAFALVREAGRRNVAMRHFDVQLIGALVLHGGSIAEMATGEGKTLVATLSVYLNGLLGRGVHVVTVNDYLAKRDRDWMGPAYEALGLTIGTIQHDMGPADRKAAYGCDVTYGTNNEFGFDYLRDNMAISAEECVQRTLSYAIVDEVDSILIDEARTPLIISGPAEESTELYYRIDRMVPKLAKGEDYTVDEKAHAAMLTEEGVKKIEQFLGLANLYEDTNITLVHHVNQALRAHNLYRRDVDYMIKDNQVMIVDEFTGRLMPGRRWSDGLHQAIEAKEGVKIERENQTLATITFQNYFRMYDKLAGMTGTAATEAAEFHQIYKLEVVSIPTNRLLLRNNHPDVVFRTEREKFEAVVEEIAQCYEKGQPVLVGTVSIEKSERISTLLKSQQVPHHVLNAKYHEQEAQIIAQAGRFKGVTIATNMAGRGTDILLGGNPEFLAAAALKLRESEFPDGEVPEQVKASLLEEVKETVPKEHEKVVAVGGLHVIGTERHEARRIDNQLRGRSGRQGDPGSNRFYVSLEDDLIRLFGENKMLEWAKAAIPEGEAIEHPLLGRAIETAQRRVESHNFDIRKRLLDYDNVMSRQREVIYKERRMVLEGQNLKSRILEMLEGSVDGLLMLYASSEQEPDEWNLKTIAEAMQSQFGVQVPDLEKLSRDELEMRLKKIARESYDAREATLGAESMRQLERWVMLQLIDTKWKEHLYSMDHLREGIGYRVYGQQDPLVEYQHEAYEMFTVMVDSVQADVVEMIFKIQPVHAERISRIFSPTQFLHPDASAPAEGPPQVAPGPVGTPQEPSQGGRDPFQAPALGRAMTHSTSSGEPVRRGQPKVGRNDPCPCGSGKKYKKCHGS